MKARISLLHKTESEWSELSFWIPEAGEVIVYDPDDSYNYARLKIGDGVKSLQELDFFIESTVKATIKDQQYLEIIDAGRITDY